jgi:hypothetical protein
MQVATQNACWSHALGTQHLIAIFYFFGQKLSVHSSNFIHRFSLNPCTYHLKEVSRVLYQQPSCSIDLWNCIITRHKCEFCDELHSIWQHGGYMYREMCIVAWFKNMQCVHHHLCFRWMIINNTISMVVKQQTISSPSITFYFILLTNRPSQV